MIIFIVLLEMKRIVTAKTVKVTKKKPPINNESLMSIINGAVMCHFLHCVMN